MSLVHESALTDQIIAAAIDVHRSLGPGLLESAYEECLCVEFRHRGISYSRQVAIPLVYRGISVECAYRMDLVVENAIVVEIKSVDTLLSIHKAQLLTYLRLSGHEVGLLLNFNVKLLKDGVCRMVM